MVGVDRSGHCILAHDRCGDRLVDRDRLHAGENGPPSTGRFDGSVGRVFKGDGRGGLTAIAPSDSGLIVPGDTRSVLLLPTGGAARILTANAMGPVRMFEKR